MRTKKIISLFCSMAMAISVFAGTIASADTTEAVTKGINYTIVKNDELTKVYNISYAGISDGIKAFDVGASFVGSADDLAKISNVEITSELGITKNWLSASSFVGITFASAEPVTPKNNVLATVTVTLTEDLTDGLTLDYSYDYALTSGSGDEYYMFDADPGFELKTNTLTLTKKVSSAVKVDATPVGTVFEGFNGVDTDRSVAAMVDTTLTKATNKVTWKINVTPQAGKTYTGPTTLDATFGNIESGSNMKVGLIVSYADADIANVEITGIEY